MSRQARPRQGLGQQIPGVIDDSVLPKYSVNPVIAVSCVRWGLQHDFPEELHINGGERITPRAEVKGMIGHNL